MLHVMANKAVTTMDNEFCEINPTGVNRNKTSPKMLNNNQGTGCFIDTDILFAFKQYKKSILN